MHKIFITYICHYYILYYVYASTFVTGSIGTYSK